MPWVYILIAGLLEATWAVTLKLSNGFTTFLPTLATVVVTLLSYFFLSLALKTIPVGITYAVLAGIGAICTVIADIVLFGESYGLVRFFCIALIVIGAIGLRSF